MTKCKTYPSAALQMQYGGKCNIVVPHKPVTPHHDGALPFTGFDGGLFLGLAVIFVASGACLRRAGRKLHAPA